jgi:transposase
VALTLYLDDGAVEIDNNAAERALRAVALGRKNFLHFGSDSAGERGAAIYTLVGTALCRARHSAVYAVYRTMPSGSLVRRTYTVGSDVRRPRSAALFGIVLRFTAIQGS